MKVEAETREEGVTVMKGTMDEAAVTKHFAEKHPDMPAMTVADCHAMIEKDLVAA